MNDWASTARQSARVHLAACVRTRSRLRSTRSTAWTSCEPSPNQTARIMSGGFSSQMRISGLRWPCIGSSGGVGESIPPMASSPKAPRSLAACSCRCAMAFWNLPLGEVTSALYWSDVSASQRPSSINVRSNVVLRTSVGSAAVFGELMVSTARYLAARVTSTVAATSAVSPMAPRAKRARLPWVLDGWTTPDKEVYPCFILGRTNLFLDWYSSSSASRANRWRCHDAAKTCGLGLHCGDAKCGEERDYFAPLTRSPLLEPPGSPAAGGPRQIMVVTVTYPYRVSFVSVTKICNSGNRNVSACIKRRNHISVLFCYKTISTRIEIVSGLWIRILWTWSNTIRITRLYRHMSDTYLY